MIDGGSSADHGSGSDVLRDAALRDDDGTVSDFDVAGNADLSGENDFVTYIGSSGEADLRADESVFADRAGVSDVDEVVDLGAATNGCGADAGAVDAGASLHIDIISHDHIAGLHNSIPAS